MSLLIKANPAPARVEDMTTLPTPSAGHLGRIVKIRRGVAGISKVSICMQNSADGYEWVQIGKST